MVKPMSYNMNKLTEKAQEAIAAGAAAGGRAPQYPARAGAFAETRWSSQEGGVVPAVLEKLGVPPRTFQTSWMPPSKCCAQSTTPAQVYVSPRFRQLFEAAARRPSA